MHQVTWHAMLTSFFQLATSFAWPLTIVALAILFRFELRLSLARVSRLKYRDFEAEFREELIRSEPIRPTPTVVTELNYGDSHEAGQFKTSPADTIRQAWSTLEKATETSRRLDPSALVQVERLRGLERMVRQHADWEPSSRSAHRFRDQAEFLTARLDSV